MSDLPRPEQIDPADWEQTPLAVRTLITTLVAQVADLAARLGLHSGNSSIPPSADPPSAPPRPQRGKRRGAQPGHPGAHRALLPPQQVDELHLHRPHCQADLPSDLPQSAPPQRRQITEVPSVSPYVTEHQLLTVACPNCARPVRATLPDDVPPFVVGLALLRPIGRAIY